MVERKNFFKIELKENWFQCGPNTHIQYNVLQLFGHFNSALIAYKFPAKHCALITKETVCETLISPKQFKAIILAAPYSKKQLITI